MVSICIYSDSGNTVEVAGVACAIQSESSTKIICETDEKGSSAKTNVIVRNGDNGVSLLVGHMTNISAVVS